MDKYFPLEVLSRIVSFLPWKSWIAFRTVCVRFFQVCDRDRTWKDWLQRTFCGSVELGNVKNMPSFYKASFLALARRRFRIVDDIHNIFVILDDSPLVQRCGGSGIVFVVSLDLTTSALAKASRNFFHVRKAPASAPWGTFECMVLQWGSLFAAFGFNNHGVSVYSGRLGHWTFGSLYSSWNEVTGSFLLHQGRDFALKLNDNVWGEAFSAFHRRRVEHNLPECTGAAWTLIICFDDNSVSEGGKGVEEETSSKKARTDAKSVSFFGPGSATVFKVVVNVDSCNHHGGLNGRATGAIATTSSDWKMRGLFDQATGMLSLILFSVQNGNSFSLMMLGSMNNDSVIDARAVVMSSDGDIIFGRCGSEKKT